MDGQQNPCDENPATTEPGGLGELKYERYFPTTIYFRDLADAPDLNTELLRLTREERARDMAGIERSNVPTLGGWHSATDLNARTEYRTFCDRLLQTAQEISDDCGYDPAWELAIDNMWSIINPPGSFNKSHVHPGVIWSGVYYIQAPKNAGRISFVDPRIAHIMSTARYRSGQPRPREHWSEVFYEPKPGRMILFPSWLYHGVEANTSTVTGEAAERVILSFNLYQRHR